MKQRKIRVYVAGLYSAGEKPLDLITNMRRGIKASIEILKAGFAPYVPWLDFPFHIQEEIDIQTCYDWSMAWLEVSDVVFVISKDWRKSKGVRAEIERAIALGIPVFFSFVDLYTWRSLDAECN